MEQRKKKAEAEAAPDAAAAAVSARAALRELDTRLCASLAQLAEALAAATPAACGMLADASVSECYGRSDHAVRALETLRDGLQRSARPGLAAIEDSVARAGALLRRLGKSA